MSGTEELLKNGYLHDEGLKGGAYGTYEEFKLGSTTVSALRRSGLKGAIPDAVPYPFKHYRAPASPSRSKPDALYAARTGTTLTCVFVAEHKAPSELSTDDDRQSAIEQAIYGAYVLGAKYALATDFVTKYIYIDVDASIEKQSPVLLDERRPLNPGLLQEILDGGAVEKDPSNLSRKVWQHIWSVTKLGPTECLLTFVELFLLKFLSDNLDHRLLPKAKSFYELVKDPRAFHDAHGKTPLTYYVDTVRPHIKQLFPDNTIGEDAVVKSVFGLSTLISKTSVINGFAFLQNSTDKDEESYNRAFLAILKEFAAFGSLSSIDPEFKLRLYETFMKESARQQKLGQFFTPRNVVQAIIKMARLHTLNDNAVVLDPAAGVGGFVLEPEIMACTELEGNISFSESAKGRRRVKLIGVDVDDNLHTLAKANFLIHHAELLRGANITLEPINRLMAETFILMKGNKTLGSLEYPPRNSVDVVISNPPYVTRGSSVYREEIAKVEGNRNGEQLKNYYASCGLGLESFFLRYISGALKPGALAFVIVPQSLLSRSSSSTKELLLRECNIRASIRLPKNTFFNTPVETYILVLEKRYGNDDMRPPVFCGVARTIGEDLDYLRLPNPDNNELSEIAADFVRYMEHDAEEPFSPGLATVKIKSASEFGEQARWDVLRFWTFDEQVFLGIQERTTDDRGFVEDALRQLNESASRARDALVALDELEEPVTKTISLGDKSLFRLRRGDRITKTQIRQNTGKVAVYSTSERDEPFGYIDADWLSREKIRPEPARVVTVNADGSVGKVFVREAGVVLNDGIVAVEVLAQGLSLDYLAIALQRAVDAGGFSYTAKLGLQRIQELTIDVPVTETDEFDLDSQRRLSATHAKVEGVRESLRALGRRIEVAAVAEPESD